MLQGKVVWITGASRGIGQAIAVEYARLGAQTVLVARSAAHLADTERLITEAGGMAPLNLDYDITDPKAVAAAFSAVHRQFKRLDVLVNNAGLMQDALIGMVTQEQMDQTFAVNVFAALHHMQYAARLMARNKSGSIINMSSVMGQQGNAGQVVYCASKAALIGATKALAKELALKNIRVNALAPGVIDTDLTRAVKPEQMARQMQAIGMGRLGSAQEVAGVAVFLASDASTYVTGQVIGVDGGLVV
jgi:3-oxoacyl-[acyl-carrier protein] reductase